MPTWNVSIVGQFLVSLLTDGIDLVHGKWRQAQVTLRGHLIGFACFSSHPRPTRMLRNGRGVDNSFKGWHSLYYRCTREDVKDGKLIGARVRLQNTSVNWSKYSKPWDVIFDNQGFGISHWLVFRLPSELPKVLPDKNAKVHAFAPSHVPLDDNYSHSEIWTFKDGQRSEKAAMSETVKKELRTMLGDHSLVLWPPKV